MLYKDSNDYPVDQSLDGGDSSVRAGILAMCLGHAKTMIEFRAYEKHEPEIWGMFVRHPNQSPWNNQNNYTRDQAKVFLAGIHNLANTSDINYRSMANRFFWKRLKSFFFMQNTERDFPGSIKMKRPHYFCKDSKPTAMTLPMTWNWKKFKFEYLNPYLTLGPDVVIETKMFDAPDILMPNEIGQAIIVGRVWQFYWFMPIAWLFHIIALLINIKSDHEQNQIIGESFVYGTLKWYRKIKPDYKRNLIDYWKRRNEGEYAYMLIDMVEGAK